MSNNKPTRLRRFLLWTFLSVVTGIFSGAVGAAFSHGVSLVTTARESAPFLIYLLPAGGILSVFLYRLFRVTGATTDDAVESAHTEKKVSPRLFPAVFICSVISHLFGASAGREGAALKMGGSIAALFTRAFRLKERDRRTLAVAGMSGVFSAVFGTPLGAAVFTVEVVRSRTLRPYSLAVSLASSLAAYGTSILLRVHPERYHIPEIPAFTPGLLLRTLILSALSGLVALVFCYAMHLSLKGARQLFKNEYLRISVFAALLVLLTVIVGTYDYNGGGIGIIEGIFEGESARPEAFALKILFTAVTVAAGFKGGEIVPALFTGATFGAALSTILGLPAPFGASLGMSALFAGVTNCPIATILLSLELFGPQVLPYSFIAITLGFLLSGEVCLYDIKKYPFKK